MTTRTFRINVTAPGSTRLATMAAAMSTNQWSSALADTSLRYVAQTTIDQTVGHQGQGHLQGGTQVPAWYSNSQGANDLLAWTGKAHWDATGGAWYYSAGTTGFAPENQTIVKYDPATDEFRHWQGSAIGATDGIFHPGGEAHNFQASAFDQVTRKLYRRLAVSNASTQAGPAIGVWNVVTNTGALLAGDPADGRSLYPSAEIHPQMGAAGTLLTFFAEGTRQPHRFDLATQAWLAPLSSTVSLPDSAACVVYHSGYVYVTAGGGFYAISAAGAVETRAAPPALMNSYGIDSKHTVMVSLGSYIYAFRSVGGVYRYNPALNTWSDWTPVAWPSGWSPVAGVAFCAGPVPTVGAVLVVESKQTSITGPRLAYLWKP